MVRQAYTIWIFLDSSGLGGIETHVMELAASLKKHHHPLICFLKQHNDHPLIPKLKQQQLAYTFLDGSFSQLYSQLKQNKPDILHTHGYKAGILGRIAARLTRTPVISTYHAGEPGTGMVALYSRLDKMSAPLAQGLIAVSQSVADSLPNHCQVIQNFVPIPHYTINPTHKSTLRKQIAFVGRLSHEKGPDLFIKAAKQLTEHDFHLYGDGPMRDELTDDLPNLTFHGPSDMNEHWQNIDMLLITSRHEALPLVTLEAMVRGIPVIASPVGALPELVKDNETGWLCNPEDTEALVKRITQWSNMSDEQHKNLANNCIDLIVEHYSDQAVVPKIEALYRHVVSLKRMLDNPQHTTSNEAQKYF